MCNLEKEWIANYPLLFLFFHLAYAEYLMYLLQVP